MQIQLPRKSLFYSESKNPQEEPRPLELPAPTNNDEPSSEKLEGKFYFLFRTK